MSDELVEMVHPETGGRAHLPDMPYWRNSGWLPASEVVEQQPKEEPTTVPAEADKELSVDE